LKLPDFGWYSSFEQLVQSIGATETVEIGELGWAELAGRGIDIDDLEDIQIHEDTTLTFHGYRVLVYIRDQYVRQDGLQPPYRYHVSDCKTLQNMRKKKRFGRYVATNRKDGLFMVNYFHLGANEPIEEGAQRELHVCMNCLDALNWNHYTDKSFTQKRVIWRSFSPATFFEIYQTKISVLPSYNEFDAPLNQYVEGWDALSKHAKVSRNWICEECTIDLTAHREFLHTHHVDGNKANNLRSNMAVLCIRCHAKQPDHQHLRNSPHHAEFLRKYRRFL